MVKSAVERKFQIISEAAYRIGEDAARISKLHDWEGLRGMGNVLRHAYHRVKDDELWTAIQKDLPELKHSAEAALRRFD